MTKIQTHIPLTEEQLSAALSNLLEKRGDEPIDDDNETVLLMLRSIGFRATTNAQSGHVIDVENKHSHHHRSFPTKVYALLWQEIQKRRELPLTDNLEALRDLLEKYRTLSPIPLPMEDGSRGSFGYLMEVASPGPARHGHLRDHSSIAYQAEDSDNLICHGGGCGGEIRFIRHASDYRSTIVCRNCYYHFTILETYAQAYGGLRHQLDQQITIREPSYQERRYAERQLSDHPPSSS